MCKWGTAETVKLAEINLKSCTKEQHKKRAIILKLQEDEERIDSCIASIVQALNNYEIMTIVSCCGHGKTFGNIYLKDGRILLIINDGNKYRANTHAYLIRMVVRNIIGSYKVKLRIKRDNFIWRIKELLGKNKNGQ